MSRRRDQFERIREALHVEPPIVVEWQPWLKAILAEPKPSKAAARPAEPAVPRTEGDDSGTREPGAHSVTEPQHATRRNRTPRAGEDHAEDGQFRTSGG